jgi:hypothetical protein
VSSLNTENITLHAYLQEGCEEWELELLELGKLQECGWVLIVAVRADPEEKVNETQYKIFQKEGWLTALGRRVSGWVMACVTCNW